MLENRTLTVGSLFAGIGGFELAARECGITPHWNAEIDPYCRLVLASRFPESVQYGDICKLDGSKVPPTDVLVFGSPCQSFSIASANRQGLDGASGLFFEAIRVIREMRKATNYTYPRYAIMENVPGIFSSKSSKSGEKSDFGVVLNEFVKLCGGDKTVTIPEPPRNKWLTAGAVVGHGYSIAWRVVCASQFALAQRRKRMYLVCCFDDERAAEILSEPDGERRDFTPGYLARQSSAGDSSSCARSEGFEPGALKRLGGHTWDEHIGTLRADAGDNQTAIAVENHPTANRIKICEDGIFPTITSRMGTGGGNCHYVLNERSHAATVSDKVAGCLAQSDYKGTQCVFEPKMYGICSMNSNAMRSGNPESGVFETDKSRTLDTGCGNGNGAQVVVAIQGNAIDRAAVNGPGGVGFREDVSYSLTATDREAVCYQENIGCLQVSDYKFPQRQQIDAGKAVVECDNKNRYTVRRLLPIECLKLQGMPPTHLSDIHICEPTEADIDYWYNVWETNRIALGKSTKPRSRKQVTKWLMNPYSDANAYKAIGNSLAVPCALFVLRRIVSITQTQSIAPQ